MSPKEHWRAFLTAYKGQLIAQIRMLLDIKKNIDPQVHVEAVMGMVNPEFNDFGTSRRFLKSCYQLMPLVDVFKDRVVCDVGTGIGAAVYPLIYSQPEKLIGIDPFLPNIDICSQLGYDHLYLSTWQKYTFEPGSLLFLRGCWLPDYRIFFDKIAKDGVTDVIITNMFVDAGYDLGPNMDLYAKINFDFETSNRWAYNESVDNVIIPSISLLDRWCHERGFLIHRKHMIGPYQISGATIKQCSLHIVKRK